MRQFGEVTIGGMRVGTIYVEVSTKPPARYPKGIGDEAAGRAERGIQLASLETGGSGAGPQSSMHGFHGATPGHAAPMGQRPFRGSPEVDTAIQEAAKANHLDPNTMRAVASIESSMNPEANRHSNRQYKGLYQLGREEWARYGSGDIYNPSDNARAAGRLFAHNRDAFRNRFGRDPTDTELYLIHQQGLGFYTRNTMTNIGGNPYPGMRGPQSHESFEAGWGRELERRKDAFEHPATATTPQTPATSPGDIDAHRDKNLFSSGRAAALGIPGGVGENLSTFEAPNGQAVTVNAAAAPHFKGLLDELAASGYRLSDVQGYSPRMKRGGNTMSEHAFGNAIDVNPERNPFHSDQTDLPANISEIAARHGLIWGGDWSAGSRDPMHFEWSGKQPVAAPRTAFDPETMTP